MSRTFLNDAAPYAGSAALLRCCRRRVRRRSGSYWLRCPNLRPRRSTGEHDRSHRSQQQTFAWRRAAVDCRRDSFGGSTGGSHDAPGSHRVSQLGPLAPVDRRATANKFKGLWDLCRSCPVAFIGALRADSDGPAITQGTAPAKAFERMWRLPKSNAGQFNVEGWFFGAPRVPTRAAVASVPGDSGWIPPFFRGPVHPRFCW